MRLSVRTMDEVGPHVARFGPADTPRDAMNRSGGCYSRGAEGCFETDDGGAWSGNPPNPESATDVLGMTSSKFEVPMKNYSE